MIRFRGFVFPFPNLSSLLLNSSISNSFSWTQSSLKNVSTIPVSISPLSIAVLSVRSFQINRKVFKVPRLDSSPLSRLSRFSTFSDYWEYIIRPDSFVFITDHFITVPRNSEVTYRIILLFDVPVAFSILLSIC